MAVQAADTGAGTITAGGVEIHYGIAPASVARQHAPEHPERSMHGGPRRAPDEQHLVVALFDGPGGRRIEDAKIVATVARGPHATERMLEPMRINDLASYGAYLSLASPGDYRITLDISVPGRPAAVRTIFDYQRR